MILGGRFRTRFCDQPDAVIALSVYGIVYDLITITVFRFKVCAMLKKEIDGGTVTPPHGPAVKPRLETTRSDGSITVFQNGHHKPVHRKNHLAHECGMPYKVPMSRAHTDQNVSAKARRSVDSLALDNTMPFNPSAFTPQTSAPFDADDRMTSRKHIASKVRKPADAATESRIGSSGQAQKRSKVEKPPAAERSLGAALSGRLGGARASPRGSPAPDANRKKTKTAANPSASRKKYVCEPRAYKTTTSPANLSWAWLKD